MSKRVEMYLFDLEGDLLQRFDCIASLAKKVGVPVPTARCSAQRGSVLSGRYYVSRSKELKISKKKYNQNALLIKSYSGRSVNNLDTFFNWE